jgi:hypothetical protein
MVGSDFDHRREFGGGGGSTRIFSLMMEVAGGIWSDERQMMEGSGMANEPWRRANESGCGGDCGVAGTDSG